MNNSLHKYRYPIFGIMVLLIQVISENFAYNFFLSQAAPKFFAIIIALTISNSLGILSIIIVSFCMRDGLWFGRGERLSSIWYVMFSLTTVLISVGYYGLSMYFQFAGSDFWDQLFQNKNDYGLLFFTVIVLAPILEEALFRGLFFISLQQVNCPNIFVVLITSLLWATLHAQYSFYLLFLIFILGLFLGWVRLKSGSVLTTVILHITYNLVQVMMIQKF